MDPHDLLHPLNPLSPLNPNGIYQQSFKGSSRPLNELEIAIVLFFLSAMFCCFIGHLIGEWWQLREQDKKNREFLERMAAQEARRLSRQKE